MRKASRSRETGAGSLIGFAFVGLLAAAVDRPAHSNTFTLLGDLPGASFLSEAAAVSADGSVIVGRSRSGRGTEAFVWSAAGGMIGLGFLPGASLFQSNATSVSDDGSTVVGQSYSTNGNRTFIWTAQQGLRSMNASVFTASADVSADGSVIVGRGSSSSAGTAGFIWDVVAGLRGIGDLPGGASFSSASAVTADGSTLVGIGASEAGYEAIRWSAQDGIVGLGELSGGVFYANATDISADGSVVVGYSTSIRGSEAFIWDAVNGMRGLGDLTGGNGVDSKATAVSADGWYVVGQANSGSGLVSFVWDPIHGMRALGDLLGVTIPLTALDVSYDGTVIVGWGTSSQGTEAFRAVLSDGRDFDADGTEDRLDNCPRTSNAGQEDGNDDEVGDACASDSDEDGAPTAADDCPTLFDPDQADTDSDGIGDACNGASESDGDEWADVLDNCPVTPNPDQADSDSDGRGDVCDSSYRKTDGTIVNPITSAHCSALGACVQDEAIHPFTSPALEPGVKIPGADLTDADLRDADLQGADLRGASFAESDLRGADLRGADMRDTSTFSTAISNGRLDHADLRGNGLGSTHLENADLRRTRAQLSCSNTSFAGADFSNARLRDSLFSDGCFGLATAIFRHADLRGSRIFQVMPPSDLTGADLRGAEFVVPPEYMSWVIGSAYYDGTTRFAWWGVAGYAPYPAPAGWINLDEVDVDADGVVDSVDNCRFAANSSQANLDSDEHGDACDFSPSTACVEMGSLVRSTPALAAFGNNACEDWSWTEQPAALLHSVGLAEAYLRSANLAGAVLTNADLSGADLTAAHLAEVDLGGANLRSAVLAYADLAFADLGGSNLAQADLESAELAHALLSASRYDEGTVFPSGRHFAEPPWGLPNGQSPWNARMVPTPEPRFGLMIGAGLLGVLALRRFRPFA